MTPAPHHSSKDVVVIRPTEAQLRYSQFHHKRRAQAVKNWIERLYQTPAEEDVEATLEGDIDSDCSYGSSDTNTTAVKEIRRKRRPKVSGGRRALLKNSRRMYRSRRRAILENGYRGFVLVAEGTEEHDSGEHEMGVYAKESVEDSGMQAGGHNDEDGVDVDDDPELEAIFMTRPKRRHARTQQGGDARYKRFQAACHAMMMNIKTSRVVTPTVEASTKRWKRSEQHIQAAEELKHKDFLDYKWGVRKRDPEGRSLLFSAYYQQQTHQIMDRSASWMMHLPKHLHYDRDSPYYHDAADLPPGSTASAETASDFTSSTLAMRAPGPKKFNTLMAFVQQRLIEKQKESAIAGSGQVERAKGVETPRMRLRESHVTEDSENTERRTSRAKEIAESFEAAPVNDDDNRVKQMAQSFEGGDQTPTMRLKELEFGASVSSGGERRSFGSESESRSV